MDGDKAVLSITQCIGDHCESAFLFQRLSILIQRYNAVAVLSRPTFAHTTPEDKIQLFQHLFQFLYQFLALRIYTTEGKIIIARNFSHQIWIVRLLALFLSNSGEILFQQSCTFTEFDSKGPYFVVFNSFLLSWFYTRFCMPYIFCYTVYLFEIS